MCSAASSSESMSGASGDYHRIARIIEYLKSNYTAQPALDELAAEVGLSPFHFQRLFSRWAGVSPKKFLQALTLEHAKDCLRRSDDLLSASLEVGLSGPSRLHDLFVMAEAVTPGEFKARGKGLEVRYGVFSTPFGSALLLVSSRGICGIDFFDNPPTPARQAEIARHRWPAATLVEDQEQASAWGARAFPTDGFQGSASLPLVLSGSAFQLQVWKALLRIPRGQVATYQAIANAVGMPSAARAVGAAVGANPVAVLIPCHRVIQKSGALGGYRWGTTRKLALLARERAGLEA